MLEMEGYGSSCANRKTKRGGGVAIIYNTEDMNMMDPEIMIPHNLEVIWRVGCPKKGPRKNIIFGAIYYPPRARKKEKIKTHILETLHLLMARYPEAEICIGGDKNELKLDEIVNGIPGLKQVMTPPTHKTKTIDVILTTMRDSY